MNKIAKRGREIRISLIVLIGIFLLTDFAFAATPTISVISPANTTYSNATQPVNITSDGDNIWYDWNGTNYTYTIPINITFNEGSNTLTAWANDSSGNFNSTNVTFKIDTTPPIISVISPTNTTYNTTTVWFNATASQTISKWIVNYNGTNITLANINSTLAVANGTHHLLLYANDSVGNFGLNNSIWFTVNTTTSVSAPPNIIILSPSSQTYSTNTIWFNATANKSIDTWMVNYNGTNITLDINTSLTISNGNYQLLFYAKDTSGNWGMNDSVYFTVNVTALYYHLDISCTQVNETSSQATTNNDYSTLDACQLALDQNSASKVIDKINALPAADNLTLTDATAVTAAQADYNSLNSQAQGLVTNYAALQEDVARIASLQAASANKTAATSANKANTNLFIIIILVVVAVIIVIILVFLIGRNKPASENYPALSATQTGIAPY